MAMTDLEREQAVRINALERRVLQETIRRLSLERRLAEQTMALVQLRAPTLDAELMQAQESLARLTKEVPDGPA